MNIFESGSDNINVINKARRKNQEQIKIKNVKIADSIKDISNLELYPLLRKR